MRLDYIAASGDSVTFDRGEFVLRDVEGAGVAEPAHNSVKTPNRDGEAYLNSLLETRFLRAYVSVIGGDVAGLNTLKRQLATVLNPRRGLGMLRYEPYVGAPTYEIGAIYAGGAGFGGSRIAHETMTLSFRCPDPAWRVSPPSSVTLDLEASGWSIPWTIPWEITASGNNAIVNNAGDLNSYPLIQFQAGEGGATDPTFTNLTTGRTFAFDGLSLGAGKVLVVDMNARTATVDGVNVIGLRTGESQVWSLAPGINSLSISVATGSGITSLQWWRKLVGV